jgi:phage gpG-like protein
MAQIKIRSKDLGELVNGMERKVRTTNYALALRQILPKLRRLSTKVFALETSPDGDPWPALAASTVKEKKRLGFGNRKILVRTGRLRDSLTRVNHPDNIAKFRTFKSITTLTWGTRVPYGDYHQSDQPRTRLPRRKFLPEKGDVLFKLIVKPVLDAVTNKLKERWI